MIYIPLPDALSRQELLKIHMGEEAQAIEERYLKKVAELTEG